MWPSAPVMFTSFRTGRIAFVRSLLHKASKSIPSGALGGAWRCVLRSNFSIQTWSSILPDAARVKDFRWTCVDAVAATARSVSPTRRDDGPDARSETLHQKMETSRVDGVRKVKGRRKETASIMSDVAVPANKSFK